MIIHRRFKQSNKNVIGLTLIEVLIALAIVGIALTAIIKATSQNIRGTEYLQNKTIAMWVGSEVLNEARTGVLSLSGSDKFNDNVTMLGKEWRISAEKMDTPNKHIKKIA